VNIFVGNLACTLTDQELRQLFELYGTVDSITVMTDHETGRSCGFGFVDMLERSAARAAIAGLYGTDLAGRTLTVNEANWWVQDR
jgi:RNA recognition motif-containing protein